MAQQGLLRLIGTVVDVTILAMPRSTKNKGRQRAPSMHQTMKGNLWPFGLKAHAGEEQVVFASAVDQAAHERPDAKHAVTRHIARGPEWSTRFV